MARSLITRDPFGNWDPFRELADIRSRFDRLLGSENGEGSDLAPASISLDIVEEDNQYRITAQVPGLRPEDLDIRVENDVLTIRGEHREEHEEQEKNYLRRELRYGSMQRSLRLPPNADTEHIDANVEDGMLTLDIPKRQEARPKSIQVKPKSQLGSGGQSS